MSATPRVAVTLPPGWKKQMRDGVLFGATGQMAGTGAPSYVVAAEPGNDAAIYAASQLPHLKQVLGRFRVVSEHPRSVGAHKGVLREQTFEAGGTSAVQLQYFVVSGNLVYVMTFTCHPSAIAEGRSQAEQLFRATALG